MDKHQDKATWGDSHTRMPRQTSDPVRSLPTPPSQHFNAWLADGRGSVKRQSLKPEDALLAFHDARPNRPQHRPEQHQNLYQQTRHESLSGIGQQRTPRRSQHTQSAPALPKPRPLTVYVGNTLGSIDEDPSSESSLPLPPPLQDAALKIKEAVQRVYRPIDWRKIPSPVFECVLDQLRLLHTSKQGNGCTTCYMRDLCAMQMTCKPWFSAAQHRLYSCVSIEGEDAPEKLKRFKVKHGARLVLLRRTLRAKALLAALVRDLRVPDPIIPLYQATGDPNPEYDDYLCLLASVVMACPNLELFAGFYPFYNHTFDRLTHALSTRRKLKQHVWVIAENADCTARAQKQLPPGIMDHDQSYQFLQYHDRWTQLETLLLCSPGSLGVLEHEVFVHALRSLPKLKHLCISSFDADDFHDGTLQTLPHIMSLRLEECPGVSDAGLTRWAASPNAVLIERLSLIHQNLTSLVTIARLLSSLDRLTKLTIIQSDTTPSLPLDTVVFQPFFASKTLQFLHWDIATSSTHSTDHSSPTPTLSLQDALATTDPLDATLPQTPNAHLALSLLHHGFPSLTRLRAPRDTDPRGALQAVCRPARDMNVLLEHDTGAMRFGRCWSGRNGGAPNQQLDEGGNHLQTARIRAQRRIERAAIQGPDVEKSGLGWKVVVEDYSACSTPGSGVGSTEQVSPAVVEKGGLEASNDCGNGSAVSGMGSYSRSDGDQSSSGSSSSSTTIRSSTEATPNSSSSSSSRSDPSVAYGVSEETELRDRYVVGHDWDKEVIVSSSSCSSSHSSSETGARIPTCAHERHVSAPTLPRQRQSLPPQPHPQPHPLPLRGVGPATLLQHSHTLPNLSLPLAPSLSQLTTTHPPPQKVREFRLPTCVGRVNIHISAEGRMFAPPELWLRPDRVGREGNGGVVGWGDLLGVERKRNRNKVGDGGASGAGWGKNGKGDQGGDVGPRMCDGSWNWNWRGRSVKEREFRMGWGLGSKGREEGRWRHQLRRRGGGGEPGDVGVEWIF